MIPHRSQPSTRAEPTTFDQVYTGQRRRPATVSLNVQWIPVAERSGSYQWSGGDVNSRKVKTVTYFGTGEMRGQQTKVTTPPGSDYTDAYLSAFAAKPIPTRHVNRLSTAVFANATPIPLKPTSVPLSSSSFTKMSETRLSNTNKSATSSSREQPTPSGSASTTDRSSTLSSSFISSKPSAYEPFSTTQYSSPQSQTFTTSYSTLLRSPPSPIMTTPVSNVITQRSYTTFSNRSQPSPPTFPTTSRADSPYDNLYKPLPPYSVQAYPPTTTYSTSLVSPASTSSTGSTYKPYVPFQSAPWSSSFSSNRVSPTTSYNERSIDRPETLSFRYNEDIRPSTIEQTPPKPSSPPADSPITPTDMNVDSERTQTDGLSAAASKPIEILEKTISKYDSLINQISEVLASVSPMSSTISSLSPGKNVLDYQLSSDDSPTLQQRDIGDDSSLHSTTTQQNTAAQRRQASHLIREDSYDKIVTAISDLDTELTSLSEVEPSAPVEDDSPSTVPPEESEQAKTSSTDEQPQPALSDIKEEEPESPSVVQEETNIPATDDQLTSSPMVFENEETNEFSLPDLIPSTSDHVIMVNEENEEEPKEDALASESKPESETSLVTSTSNEEVLEETPLDDSEASANKRNGKHVTWSESVVDNEEEEDEDEESSLQQSLVEQSTDAEEQQMSVTDTTESQIDHDQQTIRPSSPIQSVSTVSDSTDEQPAASEDIQPQRSIDVLSPSIVDFTQELEPIRKELSPPIVAETTHDDNDVVDANQRPEAVESKEEVTANEQAVESTVVTILSPIDTLADSVTTRFISSDVYHGYLGEHVHSVTVSN